MIADENQAAFFGQIFRIVKLDALEKNADADAENKMNQPESKRASAMQNDIAEAQFFDGVFRLFKGILFNFYKNLSREFSNFLKGQFPNFTAKPDNPQGVARPKPNRWDDLIL